MDLKVVSITENEVVVLGGNIMCRWVLNSSCGQSFNTGRFVEREETSSETSIVLGGSTNSLYLL